MTEQQSQPIEIPFPDVESPRLKLTAAPARLQVSAGEGEPWVSGSYTDPSGGTAFKVSTDGSETRLSHDRNLTGLRKGVPQFDLTLGTGKPFALAIETGASDKNHVDLGGLQITEVDVRQGAGEFVIDFSRPNPAEMSKLTVSAGAASLELRNLANANAAEVSVTGGAASFLVDFCGTLQRDMHAKLNTGMAEVKVTAPQEMALKIRTNATLGSVDIGDGFMTKEGAYWSEAAVKEETPVLTLELIVALGAVKVRLV
jgi:hypothetical protein